MRMLLLLLAVLLPVAPLSAAPTWSGPHVPGDLARDRLQGMDTTLLSADQVSVARIGQADTPLPPAQTKAVLKRLSSLVLDDGLYTEDADYDMSGFNNRNSETFTVGEWGKSIAVCIRPDKPFLTILRSDYGKMIIVNYLPVLPKVVRLLQAADPNDHTPSTFHPLPPSAASVKGIPAQALERIATLKPGMIRADVMGIFTTEGGLYSAYWGHYVYRNDSLPFPGWPSGMMQVPGGLVKVNVDFAPHDADILWLNGRGFWLHQSDYRSRSHPMSFDGQPDDIILRVSSPYLQQMIVD